MFVCLFVLRHWVLVEAHGLFLVVALGLNCPMVCGILVPQPRIEPLSPELEDRLLPTGP